MRAAVFQEPGSPMTIESVDDPTPGENQVVIAVKRCGICGTDLHFTEGHEGAVPGSILGHEFVGEVVAAGSAVAQDWKTGQKVTGLPFHSCGQCNVCRQGRPWQCEHNTVIGMQLPGGFADFVCLDTHNSIMLPDSLDWVEGALIEPMAVGLHAAKMASALNGKSILVIGAGPVGLAVTYWARFMGGYNIVVSEPEALRNKSAMDYGATATIDPKAVEDVGAEFAKITGGAPDVIFECVGIPGMIAQAIDIAAYGSELVIVGFCSREDFFVPAAAMAKELVARFVLSYHKEDFEIIAGLMATDRVDVSKMCTGTVGYDDFAAAFEGLRTPNDHCKIMLAPD
ncbi:MAG: (R,R)-butanediol dehydrogenase/meso-butanediol dehydrogenase/diacetyl reductase [Candidatus Azotimanducaceae bacterium]|jgi:(R,R)-butanediol dehydrogenase/meso-butanediol dehydrogenase/diacetyl reductase